MDRAAPILVVEDEPLILLDLVHILERAGFLVVPATSIQQALGWLDRVPVDAATLDADLRGVSSAPIARRLHELKIPYLVCSAYPPGYNSWARPVLHLTKPVAADFMVRAVQTAVAYREREELAPLADLIAKPRQPQLSVPTARSGPRAVVRISLDQRLHEP